MAEVSVERGSGAIATVTISNPGKLNALALAMWKELQAAFAQLSFDDALRCVIVRGAGNNFAAGADVEEFASVRNNSAQGRHYHEEVIASTLQAIASCPVPTLAAIEGVCVGGGLEIACACDLRIAAVDARFGIPINRLGFALAPSEMRHLLQLVGKATALELLLEGRVFDGHEAKDKGLVQRIVDDVPGEALATASRIAQGGPLAARLNKQLIQRLTPLLPGLSEEELCAAFAILDSNDYREGVQSFLHKRKPVFTGK